MTEFSITSSIDDRNLGQIRLFVHCLYSYVLVFHTFILDIGIFGEEGVVVGGLHFMTCSFLKLFLLVHFDELFKINVHRYIQ